MIGLHNELMGHLARRSLEIPQQHLQVPQPGLTPNDDGPTILQVPAWALSILAATLIFAVLFMAFVRYTLWGVVSTLAMVEQPQNTYIIKEDKGSKDEKVTLEEAISTEVQVVKGKPITSKIKSTMHHLHRRAGFQSRWRGLGLFIVYASMHGLISSLFTPSFGMVALDSSMYAQKFLLKSFGSVLASILLSRFLTAWVHIVISEPSAKPWYRRLPPVKSWNHTWGPNAIADIAVRLCIGLPTFCYYLLELPGATVENTDPAVLISKVLTCASIGLVTFMGIALPAIVALTRVQASLLPEEDESIIPFDRSFGGKVVPAVIGGSGALSFKDAWKTFDRPSRRRVFKMFVKFIMIDVALHVFFAAILAAQVYAIVGPETIHRYMGRHVVLSDKATFPVEDGEELSS